MVPECDDCALLSADDDHSSITVASVVLILLFSGLALAHVT
jgi:hypothetical protein